jgi:tripartite-type tricarboxylate transporter receptor subunit TctC
MKNRRNLIFALGAIMLAAPFNLFAQQAGAYPNKPIRLIVPFAAGGMNDILARLVGAKLAESLGQQMLVENRTGAGGMIGAEVVAKAPADGYTLMMGSGTETAIVQHLYPKISYNPERDFAPVSLIAIAPLVFAAHPGLAANTIPELVALAKAKPGTLAFASVGDGSPQHLTGEMLMAAADIRLVHVPYKGAGQSLPDILGGQIPLGVYGLLTIFNHAKSGKLKVLGVTTPQRSSAAPDIPTLAESGFPGFDASIWAGVLAPAATPKDIVDKLSAEIGRIVRLPEIASRISSQGAEPVGNTPAQFSAFIAAESAKYARIIKQANIKLN